MWKSFGIAKKIWLTLGILIFGYFLSMVFGFLNGAHTESRLNGVSEYLFPASKQSQIALTAFNEQIKLYQDAVGLGDAELVNLAQKKSDQAISALKAIADLEGLKEGMKDRVQGVLRQLNDYTKSAQRAYRKMSTVSEEPVAPVEESPVSEESSPDKEGRSAEKPATVEEGPGTGESAVTLILKTKELRDQLTSLAKAFSDDLIGELSAIGDATRHQRYMNMVLFFIVAIFSIGLTWIIVSRSITKPINRIILGIRTGANRVAATSSQVAAASQSLSEGSSEQAASVEETSSSLEEMSSMSKNNAENAGKANELMKEAFRIIEQANSSMNLLTKSMEDIFTASEDTSKIIKSIDEIAFQTNLLALNAAVEAARAGEAGAGFAVVADEVRNLAMRAADAAKGTATLIEGTIDKVEGGAGLTDKTNDEFQSVSQSSQKVVEIVSEIAASSNEQALGVKQVSKAVSEMDRIVQQNAANAEQSASASEEMSSLAEHMKGVVRELVALVGGNKNETTEKPVHIGSQAPELKRPFSDSFYSKREDKPVTVQENEVGPEDVEMLDDDDLKDF